MNTKKFVGAFVLLLLVFSLVPFIEAGPKKNEVCVDMVENGNFVEIDSASDESIMALVSFHIKPQRISRITKHHPLIKNTVEVSDNHFKTTYCKQITKKAKPIFLGSVDEYYDSEGVQRTVFWSRPDNKILHSKAKGNTFFSIHNTFARSGVLIVDDSLGLNHTNQKVITELMIALSDVETSKTARKNKETRFVVDSFVTNGNSFDYVILGYNAIGELKTTYTFEEGILQK